MLINTFNIFSAEEIAKKFGFEDDFYSGTTSAWQRLKPKVWALFDEPCEFIFG
jgi:potassium voltage-gated channel Shaw-related subfamily C protein